MLIGLKNMRLYVEIADSDTPFQIPRFDRAGFITSVILDGSHTFCTGESLQPDSRSTGGVGLCNEYGIFSPIGYEDTKPGEKFLKIGVGLLTRPDEKPYSFMRKYDYSPLKINASYGNDFAKFGGMHAECKGYAVKLDKTIIISANRLRIEYHIENMGALPIHTNEYCHNFISVEQEFVNITISKLPWLPYGAVPM